MTSVGWVEIRPTRYSCTVDNGQNVYPLLGFVGMIDDELTQVGGASKKQVIKCTRNAAASIALACAESPYEQAALLLERLAGLELPIMTEFRITDSVGSEFVADVPEAVDPSEIEEMAGKMGNNIMMSRINRMHLPVNKDEMDEAIAKAIKEGPDGIWCRDYTGPTIKVMYVLCDGTGVPGRRQELAGVKGKQQDGSAKTFETKIGAVFTMEYTVGGEPLLTENGELYRDKRIRYMGTVRKVDDFGRMLYQHAQNNGLKDMDAVVFLGDGAKWVWGIQNDYFPYALTGLDLYHSAERVNLLVDLLQFKGQSKAERKRAFADECIEYLRRGKIEDMLSMIKTAPCKKGNEKKVESAMGYFLANRERMDYGAFTACGIIVGSGVIEAGCKVIVGTRMKNAGMHWLKDHAEKMISLRCAIRNGEFLDPYLNERSLADDVAA